MSNQFLINLRRFAIYYSICVTVKCVIVLKRWLPSLMILWRASKITSDCAITR